MQNQSIKFLFCKLALLLTVAAFISACASTNQKPKIEVVKAVEDNKPKISPQHEADYKNSLELMKAKSFNEAEVGFQDLIKIYPSLTGAYVNLGFIYFTQLDVEKAELNGIKALQINPNNSEALVLMASISQKQGKFKDAERYLLTAEAVNNKNDTVQFNLGVLYELYLQQYDDAIHHYNNYLKLSSNDDKETVGRWVKLLERK